MKEVLALAQLQREGEVHLAAIGGFDLAFSGERIGKAGFHYQTVLRHTGADYEIDLAVTVTPLGAISRLEHALNGFADEQYRYRQRCDEARSRLSSYRSRDGGVFAFVDELRDKRQQLSEVEEELATAAREVANDGAFTPDEQARPSVQHTHGCTAQ